MSKKRHSKRLKDKRALKLKLKPGTVYSIIQITFFSLAGLILLSFARAGSILVYLNEFLWNYLDWTSFFLAFIFVSFGFLVSNFKFVLGQPNVALGGILTFLSLNALTKAGIVGVFSWEAISTLVTPIGAFIIFLGTTIAGLVILFNTSLDQVFSLFLAFYKKYVVSGVSFKTKFRIPDKKPVKVVGGDVQNKQVEKPVLPTRPVVTSKPQGDSFLSEGSVTNMPGEEQVWRKPSIDIFAVTDGGKANRGDIKGNAANIEQTLESFGITARVVEINLGPAVTQYALEVALGTKLSKVTALERDLALALAAPTGTIRIEAPVPGRSLVGIELPNMAPEFVPLRKMLDSEVMKKNTSRLAVALGLDVSGKPIIADVARMPHVLIAGQTGSGKSVCINTFMCSLLFRASPAELKFILVDPKRVELTGYNGIPHLLSPVITDPKEVISALRWLQSEMDRRYKLYSQAGVKNIEGYNEMSGFQAMPYIVLVIDELADIMLFSPVEVEDAITRIAQMSRATGIHMVLSTQRPSVDVITGLIKANIPCRIAFAVSSQIDSRVILDTQGAEKLLGKGDMLYLPPDQAKPMRIQGAFVSDREATALVSFLKTQGTGPQYTAEVIAMPKPGSTTVPGVEGDMDSYFPEAVRLVCQYEKASASLLQRKLSIGYARAARVLDQLEAAGVISPGSGAKPREVLIQSPEDVLGQPQETPK